MYDAEFEEVYPIRLRHCFTASFGIQDLHYLGMHKNKPVYHYTHFMHKRLWSTLPAMKYLRQMFEANKVSEYWAKSTFVQLNGVPHNYVCEGIDFILAAPPGYAQRKYYYGNVQMLPIREPNEFEGWLACMHAKENGACGVCTADLDEYITNAVTTTIHLLDK